MKFGFVCLIAKKRGSPFEINYLERGVLFCPARLFVCLSCFLVMGWVLGSSGFGGAALELCDRQNGLLVFVVVSFVCGSDVIFFTQ